VSTLLLDADVLIALTVAEHEHHDRSIDWMAGVDIFAVFPIVEGALIRFLLRMGGVNRHRQRGPVGSASASAV